MCLARAGWKWSGSGDAIGSVGGSPLPALENGAEDASHDLPADLAADRASDALGHGLRDALPRPAARRLRKLRLRRRRGLLDPLLQSLVGALAVHGAVVAFGDRAGRQKLPALGIRQGAEPAFRQSYLDAKIGR